MHSTDSGSGACKNSTDSGSGACIAQIVEVGHAAQIGEVGHACKHR